jgi:hypothetical protein
MKYQAQLYVRKYNTDPWTLLETYGGDPMKLNLKVQDVTNPSFAIGSSSQTFRLPNTPVNGRFFQQAFNVNQSYFDYSQKYPAYINSNGMSYMNGNIQLMNVYNNEHSGMIEYEIVFIAETGDFAAQIGAATNQINYSTSGSSGTAGTSGSSGLSTPAAQRGFLSDLDLSKYLHPKTYYNVTQSWTPVGLFGGDIRYPLIEWGYNYVDKRPAEPTVSIGSTNSIVQGQTTEAIPLNLEQMKPSIRVKAILDAIFAATNYTYELNISTQDIADYFNNLYLIADSQARPQLTAQVGWLGSGNSFFSPGLSRKLNISTNLHDYASNFSTITQTFTCTVPGTYQFKFNAQYDYNVAGGIVFGPSVVFNLVGLNQFGTPIVQGTGRFSDIPAINVEVITAPCVLNLGDQITFSGNISGNVGGYPVSVGEKVQMDYQLGTFFNNIPDSPLAFINPASCLPDNIKQIDFLRSLVQKFKLVLEPSKLKEKHFIITPWQQWITQGVVKDWTDKLNSDKDTKITPVFQTQKRYHIFQDESDSDYLNYNWTQAWKQNYGQRNIDSGIDVIKDTETVKPLFAPLLIGPIGYGGTGGTGSADYIASQKFLVPHIAKDTAKEGNTGERQPIQPKLRLAFWNDMCGVTGPNSPNSVKPWFLKDDSGNPQQINQVPLMSSYYPHPWHSQPYTLQWKNVPEAYQTWDSSIAENPKGQTPYDCFDTFWKSWFYSAYSWPNQPFDPATNPHPQKDFSVLYEATFILKYEDVLNLRFNDYIFVQDAYYLVNSIPNYTFGETSELRVQLFKINNFGLQLPSVFNAINDVCYSPTSPCDAACCHVNSPITTLYTIQTGDLAIGNILKIDNAGKVNAPVGYYRIGSNVYTVDSQGKITSIASITFLDCNCIPPLFSKSVCYTGPENNFCRACCCVDTNATVWVANAGSTWWQQTVFWADSAGAGYAPDGFYSDGTNFVYVQGGLSASSGSCNTCSCSVYHLNAISLCYGAIKCDAVCCTAGQNPQFFVDGTTIANSTHIYSDNIGTVADPGYYFDGVTVGQVGSAGLITAKTSPSSCQPCSNENLHVYFDFEDVAVINGNFQISKSFDSFNWMPLFSEDLSTVTPNTVFNYTGGVAPSTYVKGILRYEGGLNTGTYITTIESTGAIQNSVNTVGGPTYTYAPARYTLADNEYRFSVRVNTVVNNCGLTGGTAYKTVEFPCDVDQYILVCDPVDVCCDPLIVENTGFIDIQGAGQLNEGVNCAPVPPPPTYRRYVGHFYPCDGFCESTTDIVVEWEVGFVPSYTKFYRVYYLGAWGAIRFYDATNDPAEAYGTDFNTYNSCQNACLNVVANCVQYVNDTPFPITINFTDCSGYWYSEQLVPTYGRICAQEGSVETLVGTPMTDTGLKCNK